MVSNQKFEEIFVNKLKSKQLKVTEERLKVFREVFSRHDHFDVETLVAKMISARAGVSRATIYRTIDLLLEFGFINKLALYDGNHRYEHIMGHSSHEHLICENCGSILEVRIPEVEKIQNEVAMQNYFTPTRRAFNIYGICQKCRSQK
jgi:Fur family ferric uptake transcriptional regulator